MSQPSLLQRFFAWYERHYRINVTVTMGLFLLQIVHLYWLAAHVIALRLWGVSYFTPDAFWQFVIIMVDYTEIPALLSTTVLYLYELRKGTSFWKSILFIILLNTQWLHLFWITDEFVVDQFSGANGTILPFWLAWIAILIDYLEVPVIIDTIIKAIRSWSRGERIKID